MAPDEKEIVTIRHFNIIHLHGVGGFAGYQTALADAPEAFKSVARMPVHEITPVVSGQLSCLPLGPNILRRFVKRSNVVDLVTVPAADVPLLNHQ